MEDKLEIERKYIIEMPDIAILSAQAEYTATEIEQIYLDANERITHRVRSRKGKNGIVYTETKKIKISAFTYIEDEHNITEDEYNSLSKSIKSGTRVIKKKRYTFVFGPQLFEIDVYPEWEHTAIMETELKSEDTVVNMPPFISIKREVTGNRAYSNAGMSHEFPTEDK
ncbi:MAG: hypothetical protein J6Q69_02665 [Clostridia bacterium]|nr:hypothetical protein [Clostridia bacterium]